MMLAKAAAKLTSRETIKPDRGVPWKHDRREEDLLKKPHGPAVNAGRTPTARKTPLSFHKPTGRK